MRIISDDELDELVEIYLQAARLAWRAGFDAVDIRACHGYLLAELLCAYSRDGRYGGSLEGRTRLLFDIVEKLKFELPDLAVFVRLGVYDGLPYPYGFGARPESPYAMCLDEAVQVAKGLQSRGVALIDVSAGIGAVSPHVLRPYDKGGPIPPEHPLEGVERLLCAARAVKQAVPDMPVIASGFTWLREYAPFVAAGGIEQGWFDAVGFARQWLANPYYAQQLLSGEPISKYCRTCTACNALLRAGKPMRCVSGKNQRELA